MPNESVTKSRPKEHQMEISRWIVDLLSREFPGITASGSRALVQHACVECMRYRELERGQAGLAPPSGTMVIDPGESDG